MTGETEVSSNSNVPLLKWTDKEVSLVLDFVNSKTAPTSKDSENSILWQKVAQPLTIKDQDTEILLSESKILISELKDKYPITDDFSDNDQPEAEEHDYAGKKRALVLQQVISDSIRKHGIWDQEEYRRLSSISKDRKDKSAYSEDELTEEDITKSGLLAREEGGPDIATIIRVPKRDNAKDLSDTRQRGSLAHEGMHMIRALSNKDFWEGNEEIATSLNLNFASENKTKYIGGNRVGSDLQGSESVGELAAAIAEYAGHSRKMPTIKQILPYLIEETESSLRILDKDHTKSARYIAAKYALIHHLDQIVERGSGDMDAIDMLALGSFGFTSFEKAPALIELGIITSKKHEQIKGVLLDMFNWLVG